MNDLKIEIEPAAAIAVEVQPEAAIAVAIQPVEKIDETANLPDILLIYRLAKA